jgi:hypothetical protein
VAATANSSGNHEALSRGPGVCGPPQTLDGRADLGMVQPLPPLEQGLRGPPQDKRGDDSGDHDPCHGSPPGSNRPLLDTLSARLLPF